MRAKLKRESNIILLYMCILYMYVDLIIILLLKQVVDDVPPRPQSCGPNLQDV